MPIFSFIPGVQKEFDFFQETVWNFHRIRKQKDARLPKGIPDHIFSFPEKYDADECGLYVGLKLFLNPLTFEAP